MPPNPQIIEDTPTVDQNARRKLIVQQSWGFVEKSINVEASHLFYKRLFERFPEVKPMFGGANMNIQARKLYEVVQVAVRFLDNMEPLTPILEEMGVRHAHHYGVIRAHYDAVAVVFTEVMTLYFKSLPAKEKPSVQWDDEAADAWMWVLTLIGTIMADAADRAASNSR